MNLNIEHLSAGHDLAQAMLAARRARLLVAEDDPEMRALLAGYLRGEGYTVTEARDGGELRDHLGDCLLSGADIYPDLIVSDIRMPGATGLDVLAGIHHSGVITPVILITAFGDEETHRLGESLGAAAVFDKPFDLDELGDTVLFQLARSWSGPTGRGGR
jgi:DNA-binding response OmpR family regulator